MSIEQKIEGDLGKIFLSGEIDLDKSPEVRENIKQLLDQVRTIEIQLSGVGYIDSSGIAALIEGVQLAKNTSKEFYLTNVSNEVMKVIKLAHLDKFFNIKNVTGVNANEDIGATEQIEPEPEIQASENVDLNTSDDTETNKPQTDETEPSIKRDDDDGDKIKFKR